MHDPQVLTLVGKIQALVALGRIPLASETPLWTILGCIVAWRTYPSIGTPTSHILLAAFQCVFVTYCTGIALNFLNDFWDWEMDHAEQEEGIKRDIEARKALGEKAKGAQLACNSTAKQCPEPTGKIMGKSSRCIHDSTFPRWTPLAIGMVMQSLPIILIFYSRQIDPILNPSSKSSLNTPFKGLTLWIGMISIFLSQEYVGPPLRLHYNGFGEITSTLLLSIVSAVFGMMGCFTAHHPSAPILLTDLLRAPTTSSFGIDETLWIMLGAIFFTAQARILVMHINDIDVDTRGGKITLVVRVGYAWASRMYVGLNVVGVTLWVWLISRLVEGKGAMLEQEGSRGWTAVGRGWAVGVGIVLAYSIPVMALAAASLFANDPNRPKPTAKPSIIPHKDLAKVVSLQMLVTPIILSIAILAAGKA